MCRNNSSFAAILLSLLASRGGRCGVFVQAVSRSDPLHIKHALSRHTLDSLSQVGSTAPVNAYNGVALISGHPGPEGTTKYEDIVKRMRKRQAENARRQQEWEKEIAASDAAEGLTETPGRYGPSHPLHRLYAMERKRQRAMRQKLLAAPRAPTEEKQEAEESDTTEIYKNTIRACLQGGEVDLHEFCEQTGSVAKCERLLDTFERTNGFKNLKFHPLAYRVNIGGKSFSVSIPLFGKFDLTFLAQLDYSVSETCSYEFKTEKLIRLCFEDAIDRSAAASNAWGLDRSPLEGAVGSAWKALKKTFSFSIRHYGELHQLAVGLTTMLVKARSMRDSFPLLARLFNFGCRSRRICRTIIHELMRKYMNSLRGAAISNLAHSSPQLTEELRETLLALFNGNLKRIAKNGAAVLSGWLTQSSKSILERASTGEELGAES